MTEWNPSNERLAKYVGLANLDNLSGARRLNAQAEKAQRKLNRLAHDRVPTRVPEALRLYKARARHAIAETVAGAR